MRSAVGSSSTADRAGAAPIGALFTGQIALSLELVDIAQLVRASVASAASSPACARDRHGPPVP